MIRAVMLLPNPAASEMEEISTNLFEGIGSPRNVMYIYICICIIVKPCACHRFAATSYYISMENSTYNTQESCVEGTKSSSRALREGGGGQKSIHSLLQAHTIQTVSNLHSLEKSPKKRKKTRDRTHLLQHVHLKQCGLHFFRM